MRIHAKRLEDVAYDEETRKMIIEFYKEDLTAVAGAAYMMVENFMKGQKITKHQFLECLTASVAGAFVLGFKQGQEFKDAEEPKTT